MDYDVPFYSNTDDTHCVQVSYKMILKYFWPEKDFSLAQLDEITGKHANGGAWAASGNIWLTDNGFEVEYWSLIDWPAFIKLGYEYLQEQFGQEVADWQAHNGDIKLEQQRAAEASQKVKTVAKEAQIDDIREFLKNEYLVRCLINSSKLNGKQGYVGHSIIVKGFDDSNLLIHDPGLPSLENRKVKFDDFEAAWAYPNKFAKDLAAIKLKAIQ